MFLDDSLEFLNDFQSFLLFWIVLAVLSNDTIGHGTVELLVADGSITIGIEFLEDGINFIVSDLWSHDSEEFLKFFLI